MKVLLIITILISSVFSTEAFKEEPSIKINNHNKLEYSFGTGTMTTAKRSVARNIQYYSMNTYNDIIVSDNSIIRLDIQLSDHDKIYSSCRGTAFEANNRIDINAFSYRFRLNDIYQMSIGQVSFINGAFQEYSTEEPPNGDGLSTIISGTGQGGFVTRTVDGVKTSIGLFQNEIIKMDDDKRYDDKEDMKVLYFTHSHKHDKMKYIFNYIKLQKMRKKKNLGYLDIVGLGISWDDRADSGVVVYGIGAVSNRDKGTNEGIGSSLLIGTSKTFDNLIFNKEFFIGAEYYTTSKHWQSLVAGLPDSLYGKGRIGEMYEVHMGVKVTQKLSIKIRYNAMYYKYEKEMKVIEGIQKSSREQKNIALRVIYLF